MMLRMPAAHRRWWPLPPGPLSMSVISLSRTLSCCAIAAETALELVPAHPGTVKEYHQHILLQLPRPPGEDEAAAAAGAAWWPDLVER